MNVRRRVPGGRELVPALFVDRLHRQPRAGIEDQHVGRFVTDDMIHERRIGRVTGDYRGASPLSCRELHTVAGKCGHMRATRCKHLDHREP
jgi:hypothetical protein